MTNRPESYDRLSSSFRNSYGTYERKEIGSICHMRQGQYDTLFRTSNSMRHLSSTVSKHITKTLIKI